MIPISSAKINSKLATRSLLNEGRSNKKSCVCLLVGMALGVCLAGLIFYSSVPNVEYRNKSKNIMKVIGLERPQSVSDIYTTNSISLAKELKVSDIASTKISTSTSTTSTQETTTESDSNDDSIIVV